MLLRLTLVENAIASGVGGSGGVEGCNTNPGLLCNKRPKEPLVENAIASGVGRSGRVDGSPRTPCFLSIPRLRARLLQSG